MVKYHISSGVEHQLPFHNPLEFSSETGAKLFFDANRFKAVEGQPGLYERDERGIKLTAKRMLEQAEAGGEK